MTQPQPPFVRRTTPTGNELSAVPGTGSPKKRPSNLDEYNPETGRTKYEDAIVDHSIEPNWGGGYHPMQDTEIPLDEVDRAQGRTYRHE